MIDISYLDLAGMIAWFLDLKNILFNTNFISYGTTAQKTSNERNNLSNMISDQVHGKNQLFDCSRAFKASCNTWEKLMLCSTATAFSHAGSVTVRLPIGSFVPDG